MLFISFCYKSFYELNVKNTNKSSNRKFENNCNNVNLQGASQGEASTSVSFAGLKFEISDYDTHFYILSNMIHFNWHQTFRVVNSVCTNIWTSPL